MELSSVIELNCPEEKEARSSLRPAVFPFRNTVIRFSFSAVLKPKDFWKLATINLVLVATTQLKLIESREI